MSDDSLWSVVVLAAVILLVAAGWQYAAVSGATTTIIGNESHTVQTNETIALDANATRYNVTSVTANTSTGGNETYVEGEDYTVNEWQGTLTWTAETDGDDGSEAYVSYEAKQQTDRTARLAGVLVPLRELLPFLLFAVVGAAVLSMIDRGWGT